MKKKRSKILKSDSKYHPLISVTNVIELNFFFQIAFLKNCYLITKELSVLRQHIFYFDNFNTNWSSNRIRRGICGKRWKLQEMMVFLSPIKLYKILTHCHSALRSGGWLMENGSGGGGGIKWGREVTYSELSYCTSQHCLDYISCSKMCMTSWMEYNSWTKRRRRRSIYQKAASACVPNQSYKRFQYLRLTNTKSAHNVTLISYAGTLRH